MSKFFLTAALMLAVSTPALAALKQRDPEARHFLALSNAPAPHERVLARTERAQSKDWAPCKYYSSTGVQRCD